MHHRALPLEDLLMLLSAALLEQQLVFFCPSISLLSACVLGLLPLLRPYAWYVECLKYKLCLHVKHS